MFFLFFFNDTATTEIYTLSLHDALPIYRARHGATGHPPPRRPGLGRGDHRPGRDLLLHALSWSHHARPLDPVGGGQPRRRGVDAPRAREEQHSERDHPGPRWGRGPRLAVRHRT